MGPELTPDEEKKLDKIIDCDISDFIEAKHIYEVPILCEGLGEEIE